MASHMTVNENKSKGKGRRLAWIIPLVVLGVALLAYLGGVAFFNFYFMPRTTLDGQDVSLRSAREVAEEKSEALASYQTHVSGAGVDLIILDVMMPGLSGYKTCARIRETSNVPILFLTARGMDTDLTLGFSAGGDDYLSKPFSNAELLSRVKALLRRYHVYGGKEETVDGRELSLTELEYRLLRLMMEHRGKIFSAENLYESVWGEPYFSVSANTVMVHIRKLRAKIEDDPQNPRIVKTVWGKGYRVE